jgi:hypothetical protein
MKLEDLKSLDTPFHIVSVENFLYFKNFNYYFFFCNQKINDPSGDSFIQNPNAPYKDDNVHVSYYTRTKEQNAFIGLPVS